MQQYSYRNRTGPGLGTFAVVAASAFLVVFSLGLFRPSGTMNAYERIQQLSWQLSNLARKSDFGIFSLNPWAPEPQTAQKGAEPGEAQEAEASYRVRRGDTLSRIAERHGTTASVLAAHNGLRDPDLLEVGQTLRIPGAAAAAAAAATAPAEVSAPARVASARPEPGPTASGALPAVSSPPPAEAGGAFAHVDALLAMADEELREARFERALHTTVAIERLLGSAEDAEGAAARRARMEVVRATAYTAVGHHQQVQNALGKALDADPDLQLDPAHTPPKLLQALEVAREIRTPETAAAAN